MDALAFLDKAAKSKPQPVYALAGDEAFLKRQVVAALERLLLGDADPAFALSSVPGDKAEWSTIRGELETMPFLGPRRVVVIDAADPFVTKYRPQLEKYVAAPAKHGVLILDVKSWPSNTKLAKALPDDATVLCKSPQSHRIAPWCVSWAKAGHGKKLDADAAGWLVELVGPEMGLLDQELAKLASYVGDRPTITRPDVDALVGRSRAAETFKIFDAIGGNKPAEALAILGRLLDAGEEPLKVLGAFSWQLQRLAKVGRLARLGRSVSAAFDEVGVPPFARTGMEQQLRHLGQPRVAKLLDWLIETDLAMKSTDDLPERLLLERLVVRMARPK
ncbi:MAG: DNA polymerase III subunit delta [Gemmataceae bacterium]